MTKPKPAKPAFPISDTDLACDQLTTSRKRPWIRTAIRTV